MDTGRKPRLAYIYVFIVAGVITGAVVAGLFAVSGFFRTTAPSQSARDVDKLYEKLARDNYQDPKPLVVEAVLPAVVSVTAQKAQGRTSSGSGFIVDERGYILTNGHVVADAQTIEVALHDKRKFPAKLQGVDAKTDIAIIKINAAGLEAIRWGDSDLALIGETVLAVGCPFGVLGHTVTDGIISQKNRAGLGAILPGAAGPFAYEDFLQTNATLVPGNSGGPLFDMRGQVVGVNTAIFANEQFGLAAPSNIAKFVAERLIRDGKVVRGYLGVEMHDIDNELAATLGEPSLEKLLETLGLKTVEGVYVTSVLGRPAIEAGIREGDVIVSVGGQDVADTPHFRLIVAEMTPGEKVNIEIIRKKERITREAALAQQPD